MSHKKYREETNCLNCGAEVKGKFCSECGQENLDTHENIFHVAGHFISDYFHYDSKFFRSVLPLFTKPGFLTKEYWEGRRVQYIHPLRLFFFVTILFVIASNTFYSHFEKDIKSAFKQDSVLSKLDDKYLETLPDSSKIYLGKKRDSMLVKDIKAEKARDIRMMSKLKKGTDDVFQSVKYVTFLMLPIYALLFKLFYIRRKSFYVDHLVYTMHVQSFAYCVLSAIFFLTLLLPLSLDLIRQISFGIIFIYVAISLRYLYHQPWWKTILKSAIATFLLFFVTIFIIFIIAGLDAMFIQ
jgi:hypothetical protein